MSMKARMLAYIFMPNLTYLEQIYYIGNVCKVPELCISFVLTLLLQWAA